MITVLTERKHRPALDALLEVLRESRAPRLRTMHEFTEQEIIIPEGPFQGRKYRVDRQPYGELLFDQIDSGYWPRILATGPTQSGKTFHAFVVPIDYHLFEIKEKVICGLPDMTMAKDKWRDDLLPTIEATRYRELLPRHGMGSRGGANFDSITFRHGPTLRFMSGGGGDKSVAGYTARVLAATEIDGMDQAGDSSREADRITQMEARTRAYGSRRRIYLECTVSIEEGRTWTEYNAGTQSKIVLPCPSCREWVTPEREHFVGHQDADTVYQAREKAAFCCPSCAAVWSEEQRVTANLRGKLLHKGQEIAKSGKIRGDVPPVETLGFRWTAVNNLFVTAADVAADEYKRSNALDEDNAEREIRQFVWAMPHESPIVDVTPLDARKLSRRTAMLPKGLLPSDTKIVTLHVDLGKYLSHWCLLAFRESGSFHVADYGRFEIPLDDFPLEQALTVALREFNDFAMNGWSMRDASEPRVPDLLGVDCGWQQDVAAQFCRRANEEIGGRVWFPTKGFGAVQESRRNYNKPKRKNNTIRYIGEQYHVVRFPALRCFVLEVNADYWKTWVHERLASDANSDGAMTLYDAMPNEHLSFVKHITAETKETEFIPGKGMVARWKRVRPNNHWLDTLYNAAMMMHFAGARVTDEQAVGPVGDAPSNAGGTSIQTITMPDGRPFLATER